MTRFSLAFLALVLANCGATAAEKSYRLGDLEPSAASAEITQYTTVPELAKLGFQEGTNLVIDRRVGDCTPDREPIPSTDCGRCKHWVDLATASPLALYLTGAALPTSVAQPV